MTVKYLNDDNGYAQWPNTRGNHTDPAAIERVNALPECVRDHVWTDDPCHSYIPEGWKDLLVKLHNALVQVAPDYRVNQIKEKFGGLRFYTNISYEPDSPAAIIETYYGWMSERTCDVCGEDGEIKGGSGWLSARCDKHAEPLKSNPPKKQPS